MAEQTRTTVTGLIALSLCLAAGAVVGCSSNSEASSASDSDGGDDADIACTNDPRVETFALNMTHKGTAGLSFVITGTDFNPPAKANNSWTVKILDANGQPVKDAMLSFPKTVHPSDPWMPDHSHGALPAKSTNNMDGTYTITPLDFFMGGVWSTEIDATSGSVTDSTVFTFCIPS